MVTPTTTSADGKPPPPSSGAPTMPASSNSSRGSRSLNKSGSSSNNKYNETVLDVSDVPEGSPLSPNLVQTAVTAKPTTFDPKEEEKRPSTKSLSKKKGSSRRSRRHSHSKSRLKKKIRDAHQSDEFLDDDDDDGSVFSISSLGSFSSSYSAGSKSTNRTRSSHKRGDGGNSVGRAPYPQQHKRNDFLNDHDPDDLSMELGIFPSKKKKQPDDSEATLNTGNLASVKSVNLESVPLEESLVPPSGVDKNGVSLASPKQARRSSAGSSNSGSQPPNDLNLDAADQYFFSTRKPKSYNMAMNDWVMRQMGDGSTTSSPSTSAKAAGIDAWDDDNNKEADKSRHVRDVFASIGDVDLEPPPPLPSEHKSSPRVFNSIRSTWMNARNSILGVQDMAPVEERVAMTTNIAPAHYNNSSPPDNNKQQHDQALAVVCENEFPPGELQTPPRRNVLRQLFGRNANSSAATMEYLRDHVDEYGDTTHTDRTEPSTGGSRQPPFGVFRILHAADDYLYRGPPRCDLWSNHRRLAILFLGSILAAIIALTAVLIVNTNDEPHESSWDISYGPRSNPQRPNTALPPVFTTDNDGVDENANSEAWTMDNLMQLLSQVTSRSTLDNPDTPQGQAMQWLGRDLLLDDTDKSYLPDYRVVQRYILATLYFSTTLESKEWYTHEKWLTPTHECTWFGIMCGNDGSLAEEKKTVLNADLGQSVTYINLSSNDLHGRIPPEIARLGNLAQLHLYDNFLSGPIPLSIGELSQLHTLFLDFNFLEGEIPVTVDDLKSLENLDLSNNSLEGDIPNLANLNNLVYIRLDNNNLEGDFPESLAKLEKVEVLTMGNNGIRGKLPPALEQHEALIFLHLHENKLEGSIPEFKSPVLEEIHLDNNRFSGEIPLIVEPGTSPHLRELRLERNKLSGTIPLHLGDMYSLEKLWLDDNNLKGKIPHEIGRLENLRSLRVLQNDLSGTVPGPVCALRSYSLTTFQATCDGSNPDLECSCCTRCTY